ncbi:putative F-box/kelch-repeat protein At1g12870 [Bidens hawaiensis]|uniref:putative F-box/kelch-repeat protein At1g12870 n=1 Tax=Bidens hawaiensis TaxID=980011 RepID=UPI004048F7D8
MSNIVVSLPDEAYPQEVNILTTLNGLICLSCRNTNKLFIWNPLTNAFKTLPTTTTRGIFNTQSDTVGFYLQHPNAYALLHVKHDRDIIKLYKYSPRSGVWKKVGTLNEYQLGTKDHQWKTGTFNNGVLYFVVEPKNLTQCVLLLAFDAHTKKLYNTTFPKLPTTPSDAHLLVIHNDLHMFVTHGFPYWTVDLWKMTSHAWTKVWVFPPIRPMLTGVTITFITTTGKFMVVSDDGFTNEIDTTKDGDDSYHSLPYYM